MVPATIDQVVVRSGEWRRTSGAAKALNVAQQSAAARVSVTPMSDPPRRNPGPDATTIATPTNDSSAPPSLAGVRTSDLATTARSAVMTGVAAIRRAESPAVTDVIPVVHRIW